METPGPEIRQAPSAIPSVTFQHYVARMSSQDPLPLQGCVFTLEKTFFSGSFLSGRVRVGFPSLRFPQQAGILRCPRKFVYDGAPAKSQERTSGSFCPQR